MAYVNDFGIVTTTESRKSIARRERERERLPPWMEREDTRRLQATRGSGAELHRGRG